MIFALIPHKTGFTEKAAACAEKPLDFRLLDLHLERISDIALSPLEWVHDRHLIPMAPINGEIERRNESLYDIKPE
jgi:ATP-binding cassette, subfamily B, bacterial CvaB/MchF/RaxB